MNKITDRELLAICNLSNLRMEFANIIDKETEIDDIENKLIESADREDLENILTLKQNIAILKRSLFWQRLLLLGGTRRMSRPIST